ncbi:MAG: cyclic nucleotide-binding domain-containing protein [Actinomycetes bacterium]
MPVDHQRLLACSLFSGMDHGDLRVVAAKMDERIVTPGERLMRQGASGYSFFVVLSGEAEVSRDAEPVARLVMGDFFGEGAVLDATRRNATVTAVTDMVVAEMFGADMAKLDSDSPDVHARLRAAIEARRPV